MQEFWSTIAKRHPKTLEKHYLEKVFVSRFREVKKPYKNQWEINLFRSRKHYHETL